MQWGPFPEHVPHKTKAVHKNSVRGGLVPSDIRRGPKLECPNRTIWNNGGPIESGVGMDED